MSPLIQDLETEKSHKEPETGRREAQRAVFKGMIKQLWQHRSEAHPLGQQVLAQTSILGTNKSKQPGKESGVMGRRAHLQAATPPVQDINFIRELLLGTLLTHLIYS